MPPAALDPSGVASESMTPGDESPGSLEPLNVRRLVFSPGTVSHEEESPTMRGSEAGDGVESVEVASPSHDLRARKTLQEYAASLDLAQSHVVFHVRSIYNDVTLRMPDEVYAPELEKPSKAPRAFPKGIREIARLVKHGMHRIRVEEKAAERLRALERPQEVRKILSEGLETLVDSPEIEGPNIQCQSIFLLLTQFRDLVEVISTDRSEFALLQNELKTLVDSSARVLPRSEKVEQFMARAGVPVCDAESAESLKVEELFGGWADAVHDFEDRLRKFTMGKVPLEMCPISAIQQRLSNILRDEVSTGMVQDQMSTGMELALVVLDKKVQLYLAKYASRKSPDPLSPCSKWNVTTGRRTPSSPRRPHPSSSSAEQRPDSRRKIAFGRGCEAIPSKYELKARTAAFKDLPEPGLSVFSDKVVGKLNSSPEGAGKYMQKHSTACTKMHCIHEFTTNSESEKLLMPDEQRCSIVDAWAQVIDSRLVCTNLQSIPRGRMISSGRLAHDIAMKPVDYEPQSKRPSRRRAPTFRRRRDEGDVTSPAPPQCFSRGVIQGSPEAFFGRKLLSLYAAP